MSMGYITPGEPGVPESSRRGTIVAAVTRPVCG